MGTGTIAGHSPKTPKYGGRNIPMKRLVMEGEPSGVWMCGGSFLPPLELAKSFYVIAKANRNEQ
ncbi:hypothetical protein GCM10010423_65450 [Streptomyces levis]|uniref:Uncharacterized protein n=1 Tax=Streptomyces levis TaxID=285566 RepID=A0ABN3P2L6_9ACTN